MQINNINPINFYGMWSPVKVSKKEFGIYHKDKQKFILYDMVYHPWSDETKEAVKKEVDKYFFGRSFSIMDIGIEDSHFKADFYEMNRVKIGNTIRHEDEADLLKQGYTNKPNMGTHDDKTFAELYNNASISAYGERKMDAERINQLINKYF